MPRNAAEIRAAAVATGWFDGPQYQYVGNGYTIPWETGIPSSLVFAGALLAWKSYLDFRFPEPARLHDWLYCPYGPDLIGCTQEEADLALREEMLSAGATAAESEVVYQAVRLGGTPYFGVSLVDYVPPPRPGGGNNIALTPVSRGVNMADYKVVMVFQQTTLATSAQPSIGYTAVPRTGGWTESFYVANSTPAAVRAIVIGPRTDSSVGPILEKRADCLNVRASILGYRLYESGGGRGQFVPYSLSGSFPSSDVPSMSLLCASVAAGTPSVRRFSLRGMPDSQVIDGEFSPSVGYTSVLRAYFQSLVNTAFRGRTPSSTYAIATIGALLPTYPTGHLTAKVLIPYQVADFVRVRMTLDSRGRKQSGDYFVSATGPTGKEITLRDWPHGLTTGGTVSVPGNAFYAIGIDGTTAVRIGNHKVGRPFAGYRGRNSARA